MIIVTRVKILTYIFLLCESIGTLAIRVCKQSIKKLLNIFWHIFKLHKDGHARKYEPQGGLSSELELADHAANTHGVVPPGFEIGTRTWRAGASCKFRASGKMAADNNGG